MSNPVFREPTAAEKLRELESQVEQARHEVAQEWEIREQTLGKVLVEALRSGKLSDHSFLNLIAPLITRKSDWKKLGLEFQQPPSPPEASLAAPATPASSFDTRL